MKRFTAVILVIMLCAALGACAKAPAKTEADVHALAESVKQYYNGDVKFVFDGETDAEDLLIFTYYVEDEAALSAITDYVLTETDGMTADTFACIRFADGTSAELIESTAAAIKEGYVSGLASSLSMYAPDEAAAAKAAFEKIDGCTYTLVISSAHKSEIVDALGK